jgi:hypothetical protein
VALVDLPSLAKIEPVAKDSGLPKTNDVAIATTTAMARVTRALFPRALVLTGSIFPPLSLDLKSRP